MGIKQDSKTKFEVENEWGTERVQGWSVHCDKCDTQSKAIHHGVDAGEAADKARKEGFDTKFGPVPGSPAKWYCLKCQALTKKN